MVTFGSPLFWLFALATWIVFALVRDRRRWIVLLAASLVFLAGFRKPAALIALAALTMTT